MKFFITSVLAGLISIAGAGEPAANLSFDDENTAGLVGNALSVSTVRSLPDPGFTGSAKFTISCFVRPTGRTGYQIILAQAATAPNNRIWWIGYAPSKRQFDFLVRDADNKGQSQVFSPPVTGDGWIHLAAVCDGDKISLHATPVGAPQLRAANMVDARGVRQASLPLSLGGRCDENPASLFDGAVDELTLWRQPLSVRELDALFQLGKKQLSFSPATFQNEVDQSKCLIPKKPEAETVFEQLPVTKLTAPVQEISPATEYVFPVQLASGDFSVQLQLNMPDPATTQWIFELGADAFYYNGADLSLKNMGNHGSADFRNRPLLHHFKEAQKTLTLKILRRGKNMDIFADDQKIWSGIFSRDTVGELAVKTETGNLKLSQFTVEGALLERNIVPVFRRGEADSAYYRIPALAADKNGTLYAFAEARRTGLDDVGAIDIAFKRSDDGGKTWSPVKYLAERGAQGYSSNNPSPVIDNDGKIMLFYVEVPAKKWGTGDYRVAMITSADQGRSWSPPYVITPQLPKDWQVFLPGPGHSLILRHGKYAGRLVVPGWCARKQPDGKLYFSSTLIYSDDHGKTFYPGGIARDLSDECMLAELADGSLLMAIRPSSTVLPQRYFAVSTDGGQTFSPAKQDMQLRAIVCQNSIAATPNGDIQYVYPAGGNYMPNTEPRRAALTLQSKKPGDTQWGKPYLIHAGRSGYSDLAVLPDQKLAVLFEGDRQSDTGAISYTCIDANQ